MGFMNEVLKPFLKREAPKELSSSVEPQNIINDFSSDYQNTGSFFDSSSNFLGKSEQVDLVFRQKDKILKYRQVATIPDVNDGIDEIVNEIIFSLDKEDIIMFRFATKEEIKDFKNRQKDYKQKKKEIDTLQKQITKLYKEL